MKNRNDSIEAGLIAIMALALFLMFMTACAPKHATDQAPTAAPSPSVPQADPASGSSLFCGDLLLWASNTVFLIDQVTYAASIQPDGLYGHDQYTTGLGAVIPACHYQVANGIPALN